MTQKGSNLGRAMFKSRFVKGGSANNNEKKKSVKSVLEESELQKIFSMGELIDKDFTAIRIINNTDSEGILNDKEIEAYEVAKVEYASLLTIPRRPKNAQNMTKEQLLASEKDTFVKWRRQLAEVEKDQRVKMTPYEMNLDFWRQLWRVIERSDVLVQVVDARNPLLFRNEDLESYVKEVDENKINVLLINKSDFLTKKQRIIWAKYFDKVGLRVIFWSAKMAEGTDPAGKNINLEVFKEDELEADIQDKGADTQVKNSCELVGVNGLISILEGIETPNPFEDGKVTVGLVGYPNVGKSSSINAIYGRKKLSISATPGHTKRFQTLNITDKLIFCDCPGLVMPSIVHSRGHLMVSGILPIDTIRDCIAPINIIADQFPRQFLEVMYGIKLPKVNEGDDPNRSPNARELLSAYSYMHGMMTAKGNPNLDRAARIILKDYVDGRLLYRYPPPNVSDFEFEAAANLPEEKKNKHISQPRIIVKRQDKTVEMDQALKDLIINKVQGLQLSDDVNSIPTINKRGKKFKSRNINKDLDQHEYIYQ